MHPSVRAITGLALGFFVYWLMRRRHIPCGALTWDDGHQPASFEKRLWHPVRCKVVDGWRVLNCADDREIAEQMIWRSAQLLRYELEKREREAHNG